MDHVVVCIHPFVMRQEVSVYSKGECIEHTECNLDELDTVCIHLCRKYNINQLDYSGNKNYGKKLEEKINLYNYNYDNFTINFNYF